MHESAKLRKGAMANVRPIGGNIVIIGAAAIAVVVVLLGVLNWDALLGPKAPDTAPSAVSQPAPGAVTPPPAPATSPKAESPPADAAKVAVSQGAAEAIAPTFDIVRVEPNGDSVIAGRSTPGATIELLRNDQVHARSVADNSGLFALTPPPLPSGSHKIVLQSIAPDGKRQRSKESVTVEINGSTRPLVALTAPDKPTVLLSNPEPAPKAAAKTAETAPVEAAPQQQASANSAAPATQPATVPRLEIKIMSVESDEGKLYVSGEAAPGATVRLYLNESFIAPGGAGGDGKLSFAIASGVKPGEYRVRLDDVDPVSGQVKSRAEVGYNVPAMVAEAAPAAGSGGAPAATPGATQPSGTGRVASAASNPTDLPPNTVVIPNIDTAIVSRGDSLWRISQRIYGKGYRYTVIYGANQTQIRNPNLIYPGQIFVLPNGEAQNTN
ncbi:LysM peptidoglycan-binding domain-containing protein [Microvirga brassicacearum]|uniref:LysM peptidoglycan-binding domain-containing protein n=2 Tax=Microvirga brassicacearum TaxID=2580413 RepID=A0A5N3PAE2_9HYPH|nr:LysM peptidoglycan-binding domain-containing protein [Microvirga brassicacearum]